MAASSPRSLEVGEIAPAFQLTVGGAVFDPAADHVAGRPLFLVFRPQSAGLPDDLARLVPQVRALQGRCVLITPSQVESPAGFEVAVSGTIEKDFWVKLIGNVSFNPVSALTMSTVLIGTALFVVAVAWNTEIFGARRTRTVSMWSWLCSGMRPLSHSARRIAPGDEKGTAPAEAARAPSP